MKNIHINRDGESLGEFDLQEIMTGLASGKFLPTDLAWRPGMPEWKPLNQFPDLDARPDEQKNAPPGAPLVGTESITIEGNEPAWERREELGFFPALVETTKQVLLQPSETFSGMKHTGGLGNPLLYYGLLGIFAGLINILYQWLIELGMGSSAGALYAEEGIDPAASALGTGLGLGMMAVLLPLFIILGIFISSGISHLLLMLFGAEPRGFETTFRVTAYGYGGASVLQLIPVCGSLICSVWGIVIVIIGFARAHDTSIGKSALVVLLPIFLCCALAIGGVFLIFGSFAALASQQSM